MTRITSHDLSEIGACLNPVIGYTEFLLRESLEENDGISQEDIQAIKRITDRLDNVRQNIRDVKKSGSLDQEVLETTYEQGWNELDKGIDDLLIVIERIKQNLSPSEIEEIKPIVRIIEIFRSKG